MEKTLHTAHGDFVIDTEKDAKIASILESGYNHEGTLDLLPYFMKEGGIAVDVGAHIGTLSIPFARYASKVIAFEPTKESFHYLVKNVKLNNATVDARNKGLGKAKGTASTVVVHDFSAAAHTLTVGSGEIEISTLDAEVEYADFVKIDVEGMELSVLEGGERLWKQSAPNILFEVNLFALRRQNTSPSDLQHFLIKFEYDLYIPFQRNGELVLGCITDLALLTASIAPRAYVFHGPSAPFDVMAVSRSKKDNLTLPVVSARETLQVFASQNMRNRWHRYFPELKGR
ncbi:MAG: Methyltransferase FkbM [Parcubacteria group bacterium]|nr:Methyltransferase FkbM [Parcubacteria group bacterium]